MVLVDTSVWIRFFYGHATYTAGVDRLLELDEIVGHELVYGELLMGDRGGRSRSLARYERLQWARTIAHDHVVALARFRKLHGRGIGWVDVHLLASALAGKMQLWSADESLAGIAEELGVGYK